MKHIAILSFLFLCFSASGQENITLGLFNNDIKDSIFQQLIIKNDLVKRLCIKDEKIVDYCKISEIIPCPQDDNDTLYLTTIKRYRYDSIQEFELRSNFFVFNKNGRYIVTYQFNTMLGGYVLDLNFDGKIEIIDSHYIKTGKPCKGRVLNYLYITTISEKSTSYAGIVFYSKWHWKIIDLNQDNIFEIQIGPYLNDWGASFCHNTEMVIEPKVTFYWSQEDQKYYTTDEEYIGSYRIIDFDIPEYYYDKKSNRKFLRAIKKFK